MSVEEVEKDLENALKWLEELSLDYYNGTRNNKTKK